MCKYLAMNDMQIHIFLLLLTLNVPLMVHVPQFGNPWVKLLRFLCFELLRSAAGAYRGQMTPGARSNFGFSHVRT